MGEYEDRYPEAYGHGEETQPGATGDKNPILAAPRQAVAPVPEAELRRDERDEAAGWQPGRIESGVVATPPAGDGRYRGVGPRGYWRSAARIYEDLCDRLMADPFLDASEIEVGLRAGEVMLDGTVEDSAAYRRAQAIAEEILGVTRVHNNLRLRQTSGRTTVLAKNR